MQMGKANIHTLMERVTKENGRMVDIMVKELLLSKLVCILGFLRN